MRGTKIVSQKELKTLYPEHYDRVLNWWLRGMTKEEIDALVIKLPPLLALDSLRKLFGSPPASDEPIGDATTLFDFLADSIGTVEGSSEAFSENCGQRFAEGMVEKQLRGCL